MQLYIATYFICKIFIGESVTDITQNVTDITLCEFNISELQNMPLFCFNLLHW